MYLRTPKRYSGKDDRRRLVSFKWLWLYLLAPVVIVLGSLAWVYRPMISNQICNMVCPFAGTLQSGINAPTPTPTVPGPLLQSKLNDALHTGNVDSALEALQSLQNLQPNNAQIASLTTRIMINHLYTASADDFQSPTLKAKLDAALKVADQAINANPEIADGWIAKAQALEAAYQYTDALPYALQATEIDNKDPMAMAVLAQIYDDLQKDKEALPLLDSALATVKAQTPINRVALAQIYYVKGYIEQNNADNPDATKDLSAAWNVASQKYDPADPYDFVPPGYIVYLLGLQYLAVGQENIAMQNYTTALDLDKNDPFIHYLLGKAYQRLGQNPDAEKEFQNCIDLDPKQLKCERNMGYMAYSETNWKKAFEALQIVADENSPISDDYYFLGSAYIKFGQCDKAIPVLQKGYTLAGTADKPQYHQPDFSELLNTCNSAPSISSVSPSISGTASATQAAEVIATPNQTPTPIKPPTK